MGGGVGGVDGGGRGGDNFTKKSILIYIAIFNASIFH